MLPPASLATIIPFPIVVLHPILHAFVIPYRHRHPPSLSSTTVIVIRHRCLQLLQLSSPLCRLRLRAVTIAIAIAVAVAVAINITITVAVAIAVSVSITVAVTVTVSITVAVVVAVTLANPAERNIH
jgi:hypothetical protein